MRKLAILFLFTFVFGVLGGGVKLYSKDAASQGNETPENEASVVTVKIIGIAFEPEEITVKPGTTIRWINLDPVDHDVTSGTAIVGRQVRNAKKTKFPDGKFQSGTFGEKKTYEVTLKKKGKYPYYCNVHPFMQGVITVK